MSYSEFSIIWAGVNIVFIAGIFFLLLPKFKKIVSTLPSEPIDAIVSKSEMLGKENIPKNFVFEVKYQINGSTYRGKPDTYNMHDFKAFTERHPVGSSIQVWAAASNPNFVMFSKPSNISIFVKILVPYAAVWGIANFLVMKIGAHTL